MGRKSRAKRERSAPPERAAAPRRDPKRGWLLVGGGVVATFLVVLAVTLVASGGSEDGRSKGKGGPGQPAPAGAAAEGISLRVGEKFPSFALREVSGRKITRRSLAGKPAILWFTTSFCVPCQVGAQRVAELDDELGGEAFRVLVVFVDAGEPASALRRWRSDFANPDWLVALDRDLVLAKRLDLRFLDTKIMLDGRGTVTDVDLEIAAGEYLERVRGLAEAG